MLEEWFVEPAHIVHRATNCHATPHKINQVAVEKRIFSKMLCSVDMIRPVDVDKIHNWMTEVRLLVAQRTVRPPSCILRLAEMPRDIGAQILRERCGHSPIVILRLFEGMKFPLYAILTMILLKKFGKETR